MKRNERHAMWFDRSKKQTDDFEQALLVHYTKLKNDENFVVLNLTGADLFTA